jgi:hypothetical protein
MLLFLAAIVQYAAMFVPVVPVAQAVHTLLLGGAMLTNHGIVDWVQGSVEFGKEVAFAVIAHLIAEGSAPHAF